MVIDRKDYIDVAKGLGILFVIAGHTIYLGYSYPLYAFHMPLFFLISGILYKNNEAGFSTYISKKVKSILKPWIVLWVLSFFVCLLIPQWRSQLEIKSIVIDFYTANTNTVQNSSLWYLVCFFFVSCFFYPLRNIKSPTVHLIITILAIVLLWIKEFNNWIGLPFGRFPCKMDTALIGLIFFYVGYYLKDGINRVVREEKVPLWCFSLLIIISAIGCFYNGWANINSLDFGKNRLLYYPIALFAIASVLLASGFIAKKTNYIKRFLSFYGKNSLIIFGLQSLFIRLYLHFFNVIEGKHMVLYANNPIVHQVGAFLVVTLILSPLTVVFFSFLKNKGIKII